MIEHDNFTLLGSGHVHGNETCSPIAVHISHVPEHPRWTMQYKQHEQAACRVPFTAGQVCGEGTRTS